MKQRIVRWIGAFSMIAALAACGGGGGGSGSTPPPDATLKQVIAAAAANPVNDTSTNKSSAFVILQDAGLPAVTLNSPLRVNFTVFSDGKVVEGLKVGDNLRFAIARLERGADGNPDRWFNYISNTVTAQEGLGPGGTQVPPATVQQATTDSRTDSTPSRLVYHPDGYYTYTFASDIVIPEADRGKTHRVAIQLTYPNPAWFAGSVEPQDIRVNPYFDFSFDSAYKSVAVSDPAATRKMVDVSSCNGCHDKLSFHGGGRVDVQFCVMCHNPGTTDAESGHVLTMATMVHKLHSGRLLKESAGGEDYVIWGNRGRVYDYSKVGFPQDLRNCTKCHSGSNPATPQGDNWKSAVSKEACLTCHANNPGSAWETSHKTIAQDPLFGGTGVAKNLTNKQCNDCHAPTDAYGRPNGLSPERVHWNQNEENAARYKVNIEDVAVLQVPTTELEGKVRVKYSLTDPTNGNAAYKLEDDPRFTGLRLYIAYQNLVGQPDAVTEFTSYNNGGAANSYMNAGINDGSNHYAVDITLPANTATMVAKGTARVISYGAVSEPRLMVKTATDPRPEHPDGGNLNVSVQNAWKEFALTGGLKPRRQIVSNEKCNVCHSMLGTTSGSNTLSNAFHGGSRNIVEACVLCHDANRSSSTKMTNGLDLQESYQFKRMIHGIHGNSKRTTPFTYGNPVIGAFDTAGVLTTTGTTTADIYLTEGIVQYAAGTAVPAGEKLGDWILLGRRGYQGIGNFAAEVHWPGNGINCNACHVNGSYKNDLGPLGAVVSARETGADPRDYLVISPKAASCTACHDSSAAIAHVTSFGGAKFANATQQQYLSGPKETCSDCHAPGGFKGVDLVHGQQ